MRFLLGTLLALLPCVGAAAEQISITTREGRTLTATALTPHIIRVDDVPAGSKAAPVQSVLELTPEDDIAAITSDGKVMTTTGGIEVKADCGVLSIQGPEAGSAISDAGAYRNADGLMQISLATTSKGSFYGAGERGHKLNLRGDTLVMYNRQNYGYTGSDPRISQMNITMPLFLASDGFAVVFDDFAAAKLILSNPIQYISESSLPITYYYVGGAETMAQLTEQLTLLTGRQPLAPFWSLGYITSKYGYRTQAETEGVIDTLKTAGYPVDGIVLDLYWYGKEEDMGRLAWDPEQWPDPEGMLRRLNERGVKTVAISQPYILRNGRGVDNYNELKVSLPLQIRNVHKPDIRHAIAFKHVIHILLELRISQHALVIKLTHRIHGLVHTIVTDADIVGQLEHFPRLALRPAADKAHILILTALIGVPLGAAFLVRFLPASLLQFPQ